MSEIDTQQDAQLARLNRRVLLAWTAAAVGPLLALGGVVFSGLQWRAAQQQLAVMRTQLTDAREGAMHAQKDTDRALGIAASQAQSLSALAIAGKTSAEVAEQQRRAMDRQIGLAAEQLSDARRSGSQSSEMLHRQLGIAEAQAMSMQTLADATRSLASDAKVGSETSKQTIDVLTQTLHFEQKAWINLKEIHVVHLPWLRRRPYKLELKFHNGGRTPAYNLNSALSH